MKIKTQESVRFVNGNEIADFGTHKDEVDIEEVFNMELSEKIKKCKIPTEEIKSDIRDTEIEISNMERETKGFRLIGDRMSHIRADVGEVGIKERKVFITKLNMILNYRKKELKDIDLSKYPPIDKTQLPNPRGA